MHKTWCAVLGKKKVGLLFVVSGVEINGVQEVRPIRPRSRRRRAGGTRPRRSRRARPKRPRRARPRRSRRA
eukprot:5983198-Lingulodinium_polyedra.AAC.1